MKFDSRYFAQFPFDNKQIIKNMRNAEKDLKIAKKDKIADVKFNYSYTALLKAGIVLLSLYHVRVKSIPGHHVKTIEKMAEILKDEIINDIGSIMRAKRNLDLYAGGIDITKKECEEYLKFVEKVLNRVKRVYQQKIKN